MGKQTLLTLALSLASTAAGFAADSDRPRPNLLIILTDDQGYGDLSLHGNPVVQTPHLDRLGREGVRFDQFHVTSMCSPSRGALLTGRHPLANAAMSTAHGRNTLRPGLPTLPQALKDAGYRTALFGKWHLGRNWPNRPTDRGFQRFYGFQGFGPTGISSRWNSDYIDPWFLDGDREIQARGFCTDILFDEAMKWIGQANHAKQPFFAMIATNAPHFPFWAPKELAAKFAHTKNPEFFAMVANLDANAGRIERFLAEHGLRDNTIVVFLTDNGTVGGASTFNAGMRGHKATPWEGGHRVPLFVRWPRGEIEGGREIDGLADVTDLFPTLLELCGVPMPAEARPDGISLVPALRSLSPLPEHRKLVMQIYQGSLNPKTACVMWRGLRFLWQDALYDLAADFGQETNIAEKLPGNFELMREHYRQWFAQVEPATREILPEHIGHAHQPEVILDGSMCPNGTDGQAGVRRALPDKGGMPGPWHVLAHHGGRYRITLRRWPLESGLKLAEGAPPFETACSGPPEPEGVALPITQATLEVDGKRLRQPVGEDPAAIAFETTLDAGAHTLLARFYGQNETPLCGAFYAHVVCLDGPNAVRAGTAKPIPAQTSDPNP